MILNLAKGPNIIRDERQRGHWPKVHGVSAQRDNAKEATLHCRSSHPELSSISSSLNQRCTVSSFDSSMEMERGLGPTRLKWLCSCFLPKLLYKPELTHRENPRRKSKKKTQRQCSQQLHNQELSRLSQPPANPPVNFRNGGTFHFRCHFLKLQLPRPPIGKRCNWGWQMRTQGLSGTVRDCLGKILEADVKIVLEHALTDVYEVH